MSFAADVKNELCKAEHSRKQLELLSKGAAYAMTEDGEGCFFNTENKRVADSIADAFDSVGKEYSTGESTFRGRTLYTVTLAEKATLTLCPTVRAMTLSACISEEFSLSADWLQIPKKAISLSCFCTMRANAEHCFP